jgi:cell wall-associated NlpC family hydrolase
LGQKYDLAESKLSSIQGQIIHSRQVVASIKGKVSAGNSQLAADVIQEYITNGSAQSTNPLFASRASSIGAANIYSRIAQGNVAATIANLKNYRIELTQDRAVLYAEESHAASLAAVARNAFKSAQSVQDNLTATLRHVNRTISGIIAAAEAKANAGYYNKLRHAKHGHYPAPPGNSRASIAVRFALSFVGRVPYVWGGASRRGVDCSGLTMLAWRAAGVDLPHYSGGQYFDTVRVPLYDIQPGDLLFYGYDGDEHVAMYYGHGLMIEAEHSGTLVHVTPVRLGYGFVGVGRPR